MSAATFRAHMQSIAARISLKLCKKFGIQIGYRSRGATAVSVWCKPSGVSNARSEEVVGSTVQAKERSFVIPIQTGFPPAGGLMINDVIVDENSELWRVKGWDNIKGQDDLEYEYEVDCVKYTPKRS